MNSLIASISIGFILIVVSSYSFSADILTILNPLSSVITIGKWLTKDSKKVYFIQVESTAQTAEQARTEGLRLAVNQAVGVLILEQTEVKNKDQVKQEIIKYSSGFVQDFKIISETNVGDKVKVVLDVWVEESKIADRLLIVSKAEGELQGRKVATNIDSMLIEKNSGDRLLELIIKDFPKRAFDIKIRKSEVQIIDRNAEIIVSVEIGWNEKYFESLIEAIERTRESDKQSDSLAVYKNTIEYKRKKDWTTSIAVYSDENKANMIFRNIVASQPKIKLIVKDESGVVLYSSCFDDVRLSGRYFGSESSKGSIDPYGLPYSQFYAMNTPKAYIGLYGGYKSDFSLKLFAGVNLEKIKKMHKNDVHVVNAVECRI